MRKCCGQHAHLVEFPLLVQLVVLVDLVPVLVGDVVLGQTGGQVNAIVHVPTPEHIVMGINGLPLLVKAG